MFKRKKYNYKKKINYRRRYGKKRFSSKKKFFKKKKYMVKKSIYQRKRINRMLGKVAEKIQLDVPYQIEGYQPYKLPVTLYTYADINQNVYRGAILWNTSYLPLGADYDKVYLRYLIVKLNIVQGRDERAEGSTNHYYEPQQGFRCVIVKEALDDAGQWPGELVAYQSKYNAAHNKVAMVKIDNHAVRGKVVWNKMYYPEGGKIKNSFSQKTVITNTGGTAASYYVWETLKNYRIPLRVMENIDRTKPRNAQPQYRIYIIHDGGSCELLPNILNGEGQITTAYQSRNVPWKHFDVTTFSIMTDV